MILDEFLVALGVKADTEKLKGFEKGLDDVTDSAEKTSSAVGGLSDKIGKFKGFLGIVSAAWASFTATLAGAWGYFHGTIMQLDELIASGNLLFDVTKEQIEQQKKYKESVETLSKQFGSLKAALALGYLPTMMQMVNAVNKFLEANKKAIQDGILKFLDAIKSIMQVFVNAARFIDLIVEKTLGWKKALIVLAIALAWVKRATILAFVTNPVMWMIAAIAGLLILIDDFMTYLDGGESEFGEFWGASLKWIDDNKEAIDAIKQVFVDFVEFLTAIFALIVGIFTGNTALISVAWEGMIENFVAAWNGFAMFFEPAAQWIYTVINNMISRISNLFSSVRAILIYPFESAFNWIVDKFSQLPAILGGITSKLTFGLSDKIGSAVSNTVNRVSNYTSTTTASISVNGSPNPQATANAVSANINSMTQNNFGGMVKA